MESVQDLIDILTLQKISDNQYNGISKTVGSPNVFGGQVLAQALNAAYNTVSKTRIVHSFHSYFLEAGNLEQTIMYNVENLRDGGSFSIRRVMANQNNKIIFIMAASFHKEENGYEHQMPVKKGIKYPEELMSWDDILKKFDDFLPKKMKDFLNIKRPIYFKPTKVINPLEKKDLPPFVDVWFKLKGETKNLEMTLKQQLLAYISDYNILAVCLYPNASKAHFGNTQIASLDHSMWFYRDFDFNDWMLFSIESPSTFGARGFAYGNIFTRNGKLIASVAQEGLMRSLKKK